MMMHIIVILYKLEAKTLVRGKDAFRDDGVFAFFC